MQKVNQFLIISAAVFSLLLLNSCSKNEYKPFNYPYFHIHVGNQDSITVRYDRKDEVEYKIYLSAELQYAPIQLQYEIVAGDGLQEGRDYAVKTTAKTLTFAPGLFEKTVRIAWLEHTLDPQKNNTIIIRLLGNSKNFQLGLPGPDKKQQQLVITKTIN
jgi:hypothetical protein